MARRTVISVSISERNADAVIVRQALAEQGIDLAHGGGQILRWAAEALTRPAGAVLVTQENTEEELFGMPVSDINAALDDF